RQAAASYCERLRRRQPEARSLLLIADMRHPLHEVARESGFEVASFQGPTQFLEGPGAATPFDAAIVAFELEKAEDPIALLEQVRDALPSDGALLVVTPSLDSLPARLLSQSWTEWRPETNTYFDRQTIQSALLRAGF